MPPAFISLMSEEGRVTCVLMLTSWILGLAELLDSIFGCSPSSHPPLAVEEMFWGQKGCYVFVFLLSLPSNGPWSSFPAGCCMLSSPSYLSYTPTLGSGVAFRSLIVVYMHWARWQGKAGSVLPWKEGCLSVCLWVLRMLEKTLGR